MHSFYLPAKFVALRRLAAVAALASVAGGAAAAGFTVEIVRAPEVVGPSTAAEQLTGPLLPATLFMLMLLVATNSGTHGADDRDDLESNGE